jgi:short subunit dehydrogenase-like uncharacterized protein
VSRILVIGGYGGFGGRLSRRLHAAGHEVLVGGRSAEKAQRFCRGLANMRPVVVDRRGDILPLLREFGPDIVIDAAGPFQQSDYRVPQACIAAGCHYLDLADARAFVVGIGELNDAAAKAGVTVISGASTVPALSSAVALELARGLDRVDKVDMALSAATHSAANLSVAKAVLSYLGKEIRLPRGHAFGWQRLRRQRYRISGLAPLSRLVAMVDVPDYDVLPTLLPGGPQVEFRAGTDVSLHMVASWIASWPIRWTGLGSLSGFADLLTRLQRASSFGRGDRSAMEVQLQGLRAGSPIERCWTLIAEDFDGPEIPTLAAALLSDDLDACRLEPGARTAAGLLPLERFGQAFASLKIRHQTEELCPTGIHRPALSASA